MAIKGTKKSKAHIDYMGISIVAGTAFGISLGGAFDSVTVGMALGSGLGATVGYFYNNKN
jgi:uncharacterized membrane protein